MNEIKPRWEFDCGRCEVSWCCGPVCQCAYHLPKPTKQCWHPVKIQSPNSSYLRKHYGERYNGEDRGFIIAEIKSVKPRKGQKVWFRLGNKVDEIKVATKWHEGIVTNTTNRHRGQIWGFRIITIKCKESI